MAGCYHCGAALAKGQGVRRNVRTGTSVAGLFPLPPSFFLFLWLGSRYHRPEVTLAFDHFAHLAPSGWTRKELLGVRSSWLLLSLPVLYF